MRFDKRESKKSKSGYTWRVTFEYKDSYGRKKKYSKSGFATKKAAQVHALAVQSDLAKGLVVDNTVHTVDELFHQMVQLPGYSPNTIRTYSDNYKVHIGPFLGDADIKDLHYPELQLFFASKSSVGKSAVKTSKSILKNIGILAVKAGYISDWPIDLVSLSGVDNSRHHESGDEYLPETDFRKLLDRVSTGWNTFSCGARAMFLLLGYYLGLRISEASALKWEDVDLVRKTVTVRRQLVYVGINAPEYYTIDMTKTQQS
uniref:Arm DNA-binding domain-containing protein n=1 Tax=Faecalibaculum rodentium TaxID=1702221 RepID=UPI00255A9576